MDRPTKPSGRHAVRLRWDEIITRLSYRFNFLAIRGEGKPNKGFSYTTAFEFPGAAIQIARGHVDAKGTIAVHDGKQQYILYVIGGTGKLTLNDSKGETIGDITYKPDDIIVFQPNTNHGWVNGDTPFDFLGVDLPVLRK